MRALFDLLAVRPDRQLLDAEWSTLLGAELVAALRSQHLLEPAGVHSHSPCDSALRHCARIVEANTRSNARCAFTAYCRDTEDPGCDELDLTEAQLQSSQFVPQALLGLLQRLLGLPDVPPESDARLESTWLLGRCSWGGSERQVVVSWSGRHAGFEGFLARLQASTGPAVVLVPRRQELRADLQKTHDGTHAVELVGLSQLLTFTEGKFGLIDVAERRLAATKPRVVASTQSPHYCLAKQGVEERPVTLAEYRELVSKADELDLFLDVMATGQRGSRVGGFRGPDGIFRLTTLRPIEAFAVAEVMSTVQPLRGKDFHIMSDDAAKAFQHGRKAVDYQSKDGTWQWFKTQSGDVPDQKKFSFEPPAGTRFLLLQPLVPIHRDPEVVARKKAKQRRSS